MYLLLLIKVFTFSKYNNTTLGVQHSEMYIVLMYILVH